MPRKVSEQQTRKELIDTQLEKAHFCTEFAEVVESLRGRNSAFEPREARRQVNGLFDSLLAESFGETT